MSYNYSYTRTVHFSVYAYVNSYVRFRLVGTPTCKYSVFYSSSYVCTIALHSERIRGAHNTGFEFAARPHRSIARAEVIDRCCHSGDPAAEGVQLVHVQFLVYLVFSVHVDVVVVVFVGAQEGRAQMERELEQAKQVQAEMRETTHQLQVHMQAKERDFLEQLSLQVLCFASRRSPAGCLFSSSTLHYTLLNNRTSYSRYSSAYDSCACIYL